MPNTLLTPSVRSGSSQGTRPGISRHRRSNTSGSRIALRISNSISGTQMVMEKQPLSAGNTPNFI